VGAVVGLCPLLLYTSGQRQRPPRQPVRQTLFDGVTYERQVQDAPWPQVVHIVTVDLTAPGVAIVTTAPPPTQAGDTTAQTTTRFLQQTGAAVAVNANFFYPFVEQTPWQFRPRQGEDVNLLGLGMAEGQPYSAPESRWPALCFGADQRAQIAPEGTCPPETQQAVAGNQVLVAAGQPVPFDGGDRAYARVMALVGEGGTRLGLVVVDGKQPHYSAGATLDQLTALALAWGSEAALNLDGGGSTTLALRTPDGPQLLNAPVHTKWPRRQRPVANHLGIHAR